MGILLLLLGLLAVLSGGFKLRAHVRSLLGRSSLAVAEIAAGTATVIGSGIGLSRVRPLAWGAVFGVATLILVASAAHIRSYLRHRQKRLASTEARLRSYLDADSR